MTPGEFREFAKAMREFGIRRIKTSDMELELDVIERKIERAGDKPRTVHVTPPDAPQEESEPIKHKVEQLASLMKLSDEELLDQLYPESTPIEESA